MEVKILHGKTMYDMKDAAGNWIASTTYKGVRYHSKSYTLFSGLRTRCVPNGSFQKTRPSYIGCKASDNFKNYQFFASWCQDQVGYNMSNYQLDKDFLSGESKIYSEDTCVFIPHNLNSFTVYNDRSRGKLGLGVYYKKANRQFLAQCNELDVIGQTYLGLFSTELEAHKAYLSEKERQAKIWYERCLSGEVVVDSRVTEKLKDWKVPDKYRMDEVKLNNKR